MKLKVVNTIEEFLDYHDSSKVFMFAVAIMSVGLLASIFLHALMICITAVVASTLMFSAYVIYGCRGRKEIGLFLFFAIILGIALLLKTLIPIRMAGPNIKIRINYQRQ